MSALSNEFLGITFLLFHTKCLQLFCALYNSMILFYINAPVYWFSMRFAVLFLCASDSIMFSVFNLWISLYQNGTNNPNQNAG